MRRNLYRLLAMSAAVSLVAVVCSADLRFRHFDAEEGLAHPTVYALARDHNGLLWIGTEDGLNRYDGYGFELFEHDPLDPHTISANDISKLVVDVDGRVWVGTWGSGLNLLDPVTGRVERFPAVPGTRTAINDNRIQALKLDSTGTLWIGTYFGGLTQLDPTRQKFRTWRADGAEGSLSNDRIWAIAEAPDGGIWVGTEEGLDRFDPGTGIFTHFDGFDDGTQGLTHKLIRSVTFDSRGRMWVGTEGGLNLVDEKARTIRHYKHDPAAPGGLAIDIINDVFEDSRGTIWVLTNDGGLSRFDPQRETFETWRHETGLTEGLAHDDLRAIIEDGSSILWIGTRGGGLNTIDLKPAKFQNDLPDPPNPTGLADPEVFSIMEDGDGTLWVGTTRALHRRRPGESGFRRFRSEPTKNFPSASVQFVFRDSEGHLWLSLFRKGLCDFDPDTGCVRLFSRDAKVPDSIPSDIVNSMIEGPDHKLWIGTTTGFSRFDPVAGTFAAYRPSDLTASGPVDNYVTTLIGRSDGTIWIGTGSGGLGRFEIESGSFELYRSGGGEGTLSSDRVSALFEDRNGSLWIGTAHGLNRFDDESGRFVHWTQRDGLPRSNIRGILEDDSGYLWISTTGGLSRFDPTRTTFRNYTVRDGLQGSAFIAGAATRGPSGRMYFGGTRGVSSFDPSRALDNPHRPPIAVVHFEAGGRSVERPAESVPLELEYARNSLSLEVSALDFTRPEDNQYAHQLEGFDDGWVADGKRRFIRYTNLPPGRYTLRVRASNNDGVWNEEGIAIPFMILPPFWMTWWFRALTVLGLVLIAVLIHRIRVASLEAKRRELEGLVAERTQSLQEKTEELEQINLIVKRINAEVDFDKVLEMMLDVSRALHGVDIAMAVVLDPLSGLYRIRAATGWDAGDIGDVALTREQVEQEYLAGAQEPFDNLFVREIEGGGGRRITLTQRIVIGDDVAGFLVFENPSSRESVDARDLQLLYELRLHIYSAFLKATIVEELERLSQSKNEFVGIAAHDLRNPLGVVVGWVSVVVDQLESGEIDASKTISQLTRVKQAAEEMESLVRDLLDISAIESGNVNLERVRTDFAKFVAATVEPHKAAAVRKGIELSFEGGAEGVGASFDPYRLSEVIDNLVSNAIKYTHPGGQVTVSCEQVADEIVTHVADNGQGLTEEDLREVFRTFRKLSARPTGGEMSTGLGLAIVKMLIEIHGGRVWVESVKGQGSTFSFALPGT